ncbi:MAG: type II secretion system protein [Planctomycetota bacterium]
MAASRLTEHNRPHDRPITGDHRPAATIRPRPGRAFVFIELLVMIAVISLLIALLIPALQGARKQGQKTVCLSNQRQLILAWLAYASEYDGNIVDGNPGRLVKETSGSRVIRITEGWLGAAFWNPASRSELIHNPDKGALWPWIRNVDVYRCPGGRPGHPATYSTLISANGTAAEGTYWPQSAGGKLAGKRLGSTVLFLTKLTDIISPGAAQRAVFIDIGQTPARNDFYVHYLYPKWSAQSVPPIRHREGTTLSMADGHAEYWKWQGSETANVPRKLIRLRHFSMEVLDGGDYEPQTEDGLYDLQRLQKATWGRLGYSTHPKP